MNTATKSYQNLYGCLLACSISSCGGVGGLVLVPGSTAPRCTEFLEGGGMHLGCGHWLTQKSSRVTKAARSREEVSHCSRS